MLEVWIAIVGSLASMASIPLAVYLYLRGRESRLEGVRREVVAVLSQSIGEGRRISSLDIEATVRSKLRASGLRSDAIRPPEIVDDLVTATIGSPLLEGHRKSEALENLAALQDPRGYLAAVLGTSLYASYDELLQQFVRGDVARRVRERMLRAAVLDSLSQIGEAEVGLILAGESVTVEEAADAIVSEEADQRLARREAAVRRWLARPSTAVSASPAALSSLYALSAGVLVVGTAAVLAAVPVVFGELQQLDWYLRFALSTGVALLAWLVSGTFWRRQRRDAKRGDGPKEDV